MISVFQSTPASRDAGDSAPSVNHVPIQRFNPLPRRVTRETLYLIETNPTR